MGPSTGQRDQIRLSAILCEGHGLADETQVQVSSPAHISLHRRLNSPKIRQAGQSSTSEIARKDLRAELLAAEAEAKEKKRKAEGRPLDAPSAAMIEAASGGDDDDASKRRKLLQEAIALDKDDDDDDDADMSGDEKKAKDANR